LLAREYYLSIIQALTSFPFTVEVRLAFDEVTETECHIHGSLLLERASVLYISEYTNTQSGTAPMKYRYHLQTSDGSFIARWDNAPHHAHLPTHPHHLHTDNENVVASEVRNLFDLLHSLGSYIPA